LKIWNAQTGQELVTFQGFSPDRKRLASASWDNTVLRTAHSYLAPDGKSALFREVADYGQVWLMENFIPPLADPK
jgi:hypothetical protein